MSFTDIWRKEEELTCVSTEKRNKLEEYFIAARSDFIAIADALGKEVTIAEFHVSMDDTSNLRVAKLKSVHTTSSLHGLEKEAGSLHFSVLGKGVSKLLNPSAATNESEGKAIEEYYVFCVRKWGKITKQLCTNNADRSAALYHLYINHYWMPTNILQIMEKKHALIHGPGAKRPVRSQYRHWHHKKECIPKCVQTFVFNQADQRSSAKRIAELQQNGFGQSKKSRTEELDAPENGEN
jgi:hypothetical protein